jgi:phospholipid/cholesterol/gamma-HCH transport system permease protein
MPEIMAFARAAACRRGRKPLGAPAYHPRMQKPALTLRALQDGLGEFGRASGARSLIGSSIGWGWSWWHVVKLGALMVVLALSPSSYARGNRRALARHLYLGSAPILPWFVLLSALISVVLIRIVIVTAVSYGLSQYALEMVIRVLVLELIPLTAALFVAVQVTVPGGAELIRLRGRGELTMQARLGGDPLRHELMPRVVAGIFAVPMLAAVSCLIATLIAYAAVYGFTLGGAAVFTRTMGRIFEPGVALVLVLKTLFFSLAVALIPVAAFLSTERPDVRAGSPELRSMVRLFALILVIEVVALMSNYY